jgi:hypothetical protein
MKFEKEDILPLLKKLLLNIRNILRDIKSTQGFWLYVALSFFLTLIFLIFNFPYDTLIRSEFQIIGENIGKSAYMGKMDFSLISNSKISDLSIILKDDSEINLNSIDLDAGILSVIISKSVKGSLQISSIKYKKNNIAVSGIAKSDFDLEFKSFNDYPAGNIKIDLQNVVANGLNFKGFDIPGIRFSLINGAVSFEKNNMNINDLKFTGPDLKGNLSGSITLAKTFKQSQLNLNLSVDSSSTFLDNYKILLGDILDKSDKIQLSIKGTAGSPKYEYNNK